MHGPCVRACRLSKQAARAPDLLVRARATATDLQLRRGAATTTGPKISSRTTFMPGRVFVSTVGSTK